MRVARFGTDAARSRLRTSIWHDTSSSPLSSVFAPIKLILQRKLDNTSCEEFGRLDLQHNTSL